MMKYVLMFIGAIAIMISFVCVSNAEMAASDQTEINQYKLSNQSLAQFFQATKNLVPIIKKAQHQSDAEDSDDSDELESLSKLVDQLDAIPGAKKAISDAGMTTRDFLKFQFAVIYAASGEAILKSGGKLPAGYSAENVQFFQSHEAEFKQHQSDLEAVNNFSKGTNDDDD